MVREVPPALLLACIVLAPALALSGEERIASNAFTAVEELAAKGRAERADLYSPGHFATGERERAGAQRTLAEGRSVQDVLKRLERAEAAYRQALAIVPRARAILGASLAARDSAAAAGAPRYAAQVFERGERWFEEAGLAVEEGETRQAAIKAADAERRFREAELIAILETVTGEAKRLVAQAGAEGAGQWAPRSLGRARDLLARAELMLAYDRTRREEASALAAEAAGAARRGVAIAARVRAAGKDPTALEAAILECEAQLQTIAEALGERADSTAGFTDATAGITAAIAALRAERDSLAAEIAAVAKEIENARARERGLAAELTGSRERDERLKRMRNLFAPNEATLHRQGGRLTLRLKGLTFLPAMSELTPGNEALLSKVVQAIREFPGAALTFEGHTDSKGDERQNLALSEQRAQAVRAYLEANVDLSDRLVSTIGHGESYPIASNDTEDGRAQNRRIDLVFDAPNLIGE